MLINIFFRMNQDIELFDTKGVDSTALPSKFRDQRSRIEVSRTKSSNRSLELSKKTSAEKALDYVRDGMILGLGTGSTVRYFIEGLGGKIKDDNIRITGIPTSIATKKLAENLGISLSSLREHPVIDLDVDGADEIDSKFNLIKGGGGAHTMEKIVANASKEFIVIADYTKIVKELGNFPVPVEIYPDKLRFVINELREIGGSPKLRENFKTDNGNIIIDTKFEIKNPEELEDRINSISGVIDNGIFSKRIPEIVIVGYGNEVKILHRKKWTKKANSRNYRRL